MEYFTHLPEFQVVVCKACQYAVLPSHINAHLAAKPQHGLEKKERQRIVEKVAKIKGLINDIEALGRCEFPFPPPTSNPISALAPPKKDYIKCTFVVASKGPCSYVCFEVKHMQDHCWKEHQWKSKQKKGRPGKNRSMDKALWETGISCQRFFAQGPKSGYFQVGRVELLATPTVGSARPAIQSQESQWRRMEEAITAGMRRVEEREKKKIKALDESKEPNPWVRRTGWAHHLGGCGDREELRKLVGLVDRKGEARLGVLHDAFDQLIRDAQQTAVTNVVGQAALFEANRKERGKKARRPFNSKMDPTTFRNYTACWKQLLSYIIRSENLDQDKRPPYSMTSTQRWLLDTMLAAADRVVDLGNEEQRGGYEKDQESSKEVGYELLGFCLALLDHMLKDNQYKSVVISGLAVLGLQEGGRWANPEDYTPKLSAVIKLARLMVVEHAFRARQQSVAAKVEQGMSQEGAEESSQSHIALVRSMVRRFMVITDDEGEPSPMDWMLDTRTYGFHIRYNTSAEGMISWVGDSILYPPIQFSMQQVQGMAHGLVAETKRQLVRDLLLLQSDDDGEAQEGQLPRIHWPDMVDNPAEQRVGWSFLDDVRNRFEVDGKTWLAKRVFHERELRERFIQSKEGDGSVRWRQAAISQYEQRIEQFLEKLLMLMHISGGQAARAPEIIGIRHRNTANGGVRNVFIDKGLVLFVTSYHKGYELSEQTKVIHRFLPPEVGELLVYYLWLVLPFWENIQVVVDGAVELSPFVWGGCTGQTVEGEEEGASTRRPMRPWTSERMRKIIQRESVAWMGVKLNISAWRQVVIAIARKYLRDKFGFGDDEIPSGDVEDFDEDNDEGDSPWDLQAGHGTKVAGMIYARLLSEGRFETISQKERFRAVSQEWHRFLGFASSWEGLEIGVGQKRKRAHWEEVNRDLQIYRWKQMRGVNIQARLEAMLGPGSQFRGLQEQAINAIMTGQSPILVVMGTGGGKSMMFMLPASSVSGGTTIVVVPLVSLQGDLQARCQDARIPSSIWSSQRPYDLASIVFVTPESAMTKGFARFINRLREMHQLDRIVVDEAHTILDGSPQFRPKLRQLGELALAGVQMVYLTATLPPREEEEFSQLTNMQGKVVSFRSRTSRANVQYRVRKVEATVSEDVFGWEGTDRGGFNQAIQEEVLDLVKRKLIEYPAPSKIVIYSSSVVGADKLGEALGCEVYHRTVDSQDGKARRLKEWMNGRVREGLGQGRVIVATNALGLGIDVPDIRVVIHVGRIRRLKDYGQESGRAGRDGERSEAIIVMTKDETYPNKEGGVVDIAEFVSGKACRRVVLDEVMDGRRSRRGCEDGEERCDICQELGCGFGEDSSVTVSGKAVSLGERLEFDQQVKEREWTRSQVTQRRQEEGMAVKELVEQLDKWNKVCPLCHWRGGAEQMHWIEQCPRAEADNIQQIVQGMRKGVRYQEFSGCYHCGTPQAICQRWKQKEEVGWWEEEVLGNCQYAGVLVGAIATMLAEGEDGVDEEVYSWMRASGVDIMKEMEVYKWLGGRVEWGGLEANQMVLVFHMLAAAH